MVLEMRSFLRGGGEDLRGRIYDAQGPPVGSVRAMIVMRAIRKSQVTPRIGETEHQIRSKGVGRRKLISDLRRSTITDRRFEMLAPSVQSEDS